MGKVDFNNIEEIKLGFINYLKTKRPDVARPEIRAGNVLFIARNNIGISLEQTMTWSDGINQAQLMSNHC